MSTDRILQDARARADAREAATPRIDYARMQRVFPKQKAALTRAVKAKDVDRVVKCCVDAMGPSCTT